MPFFYGPKQLAKCLFLRKGIRNERTGREIRRQYGKAYHKR